MKIGLSLRGYTRGDLLAEVGRQAEHLGFASLWVPEHLLMPDHFDSLYPYGEGGSAAFNPAAVFPHSFVTLAYLAAATRTVRLGTAVCLVGEHHPLVLAKEAATLDCLSGGRLALGIGIGWLAEEFRALGLPFERRAARVKEYVAVMRKLWSEEITSFHGEFVSFDAVRSNPKPLAGAGLPILMGGNTDPALKRAATYANGWWGLRLRPEEVALKRKLLLELTQRAGRDPRTLEIVIGPHSAANTPADLRRYRAVGVDEVVVSAPLFDRRDAIAPGLEQLARQWVATAAELE